YDKYVVEQHERRFDRVPRSLRGIAGAIGRLMPDGMTGRRFLRHLALDGAHRYLDASAMFRADEMRRLFRPDAYRSLERHDPLLEPLAALEPHGGDWLAALQSHDIHSYLPLDILTK